MLPLDWQRQQLCTNSLARRINGPTGEMPVCGGKAPERNQPIAFSGGLLMEASIFLGAYMPYTEREIIEAVKADAQQYSKYAGKYLEFLHKRSKKTDLCNDTVFFGCENFMHLVGIKSKTNTAIEFYERCLDGTVTLDDCTPSHNIKNRNEKIMLFSGLFDFSNAMIYKIAEHDLSTLYDDFVLATGNDKGTVGYDYRDSNMPHPIPVTLLGRPISYYCSTVNKIIAVLQKDVPVTEENHLIYEVKAGVYNNLCNKEK